MEELRELRDLVISGNLEGALSLIDELEEMSKEDKINKIYSYCILLLVYIIKQQAEKRTTNSWDVSIRNAANGINRINKRRKTGGYYLDKRELEEILLEAYDRALDNAALEAFGGIYNKSTLENMVERDLIIKNGLDLIVDRE